MANPGLVGAGVNGGITAGVQQIALQLAQAATSPDFKTVLNDPDQRAQFVNNMADSIESGFLGGALLHGGAELGAKLIPPMKAEAATQNAAQFAGVMDAAAQSKTRQRAPDAFSALAKLAMDGKSIFVPADRMQELYQGMQTYPGDAQDPFASFVPDMQAQMERGVLSGGDVEIPAADYVAHMAGSDIHNLLAPDIRQDANGWTPREAEEFRNSNMPPADVSGLTDEDAGDVGVDHHAAAMQEIHDDITGQLRRAGFTPGRGGAICRTW